MKQRLEPEKNDILKKSRKMEIQCNIRTLPSMNNLKVSGYP